MSAILSMEHVDVHYGDFLAVHDICMDVEEGSITAIIGANGAGKSTLLNAVLGYNDMTNGTITYRGVPINGLKTHDIVRKGIAMAPEGSGVFETMTVKENLFMGAYLPGPNKKKNELLDKAYALFPVLKEKANQLATFLSGGQRQMLAIARALMSAPDLIICDEISLGLAPVVILDIYEKIMEINRAGTTIILVDQEVNRSLENSSYSYVMVKGGVVMHGKSSQLPEREVKDAFFGINKYA